MILGVIVLTVVTHIMSDGRITTRETVQPSMEECHRIAAIVNKANGADKYKFFASCQEGQQHYLAKSQMTVVGPNRDNQHADQINR
jgi:hypothetical protein